ncbi:hypothetical protein CKO37_09890 [Rubrivivax gelatinosus]|nr:hypothetical protein [Rubrivivax gelatinosus]
MLNEKRYIDAGSAMTRDDTMKLLRELNAPASTQRLTPDQVADRLAQNRAVFVFNRDGILMRIVAANRDEAGAVATFDLYDPTGNTPRIDVASDRSQQLLTSGFVVTDGARN